MLSWLELVREKLHLPWLTSSFEAAPFGLLVKSVVPLGVTGTAAIEWQVDELDQINESHWRLMAQSVEGLEAHMEMAFFEDTRALECWGDITHRGSDPVRAVRECLTLDLNLQLPGAFGQPWIRNVNGIRWNPNYFPPHDFAVIDRQLLHMRRVGAPLTFMADSAGHSSGENLPCAILCDEKQTYGLGLFVEWSGLWRISFKQQGRKYDEAEGVLGLQVQAGLWGLDLDLQPGESLPLPRLLVTAFSGDLEDGGNSLRRHIRRHVTPKLGGRDVLPPTSFNSWSCFGNDFSAEMLKPAVEACSAAGLEYFVIDAGWFQDGFRKGIGNWNVVDSAKFPDGLASFAQFVRSKGMKFGTWFEAEWAHKDSGLYRQHPDWFWPSPARGAWWTPRTVYSFSPDYHLVNFGLAEARQWWLDRIVRAYEEWGMRWLRFDSNQMPRPNWEHAVPSDRIGWRQIEHVTGLYRILDDVLQACPDLLIEQTAGGGYRIDLGTARRGHTFWINDQGANSDMVRVFQHGLNTVLPGNYANVNLSQSRHDYTEYDLLSHGAGGFGYSGKPWEARREDWDRFAKAVQRFKQYRHLLLGNYHRPTGQPARASDYAKVVFSDAGDEVTMEFNIDGQFREAALILRLA
jgi:hypothetical protein